jgi:hypothetical protein
MLLEEIIKELKALRPFLTEDTDGGPMNTLRQRRGRQVQAMERTKILRTEYRISLTAGSLFIIAVGDKNKEFSETTNKKGDRLLPYSSDPEQFYNDLANRVHPTLYQGKESVSNLFDVLSRHLEDKMMEIGASGFNQLIFKEKYIKTIKNSKDFAALVKQAINEQLGTEVVGLQAIDSVLDVAIDTGNTAQTTAITLNTNDYALVADLLRDLGRLTKRVVVVVAGNAPENPILNGALQVNEVNEKTVKSTLSTISKMFKR